MHFCAYLRQSIGGPPMSWRLSLVSTWVQRAGHAMGRAGRVFLGTALEVFLPRSRRVALDEIGSVESILLVRPNFRMGNTLMTNAFIPVLRERFPGARISYLAGDKTAALLEGFSLDEVHPMSRRYVGRPWAFVALFSGLRRRRFDVAFEAGMGSFSGGLYAWLSGARYRIGVEGPGERFLNVLLPRPVCEHAYDDVVAVSASLGAKPVDRPRYEVALSEEVRAQEVLEDWGLVDGNEAKPFVAVFVGGHLHKRWPLERWVTLVRGLGERGVPFVLFLGPEEVSQESEFRHRVGRTGRVQGPLPLRLFAAVLARATALVTPDSGPMHLGVALGTPTIAFLQSEDSRFYEPRGPRDRAVVEPSAESGLEVIVSHPAIAPLLSRRATA